jgi:hypothetical protein
MLVRRLGVGVFSALLAIGSSYASLDAASGDKQLARIKGIVGYQPGANAPFKAIFGRLDLPDDALAVTQGGAQAVLRLKDSSEIDIGENTKVQVGAFNAVDTGKTNEILLQGGALHFNIRHPEGGQSNYRFTTATSQIAVRGTEGFLISGASGTQVVCVACAAGDVTVQTGSQVTTIVSGQTAVVAGSNAANASVTVVSNSANPNAAVSQFSSNSSTATSSTTTTTTTNAGTTAGTTASTTTTAATSGSAGTVATVGAAGAGTAAVVVAASNNSKTSASPSPSPTNAPTNAPTSAPTSSPTPTPPGPIVAAVAIGSSTNSAFSSFPIAFQASASQANATTPFTFTVTPSGLISQLNVVQSSGPPSLAASATGQVLGPGALVVTIAASGLNVTGTFNIWGPVISNPVSLSFTTTGTQQSLQIAQAGPTGTITATKTCVAGADISMLPASGTSGGFTMNVIANSAPSSPSSTAACTISLTGQGAGPAASLQIPVNITSTSIGISNTKRKTQDPIRQPR